MDFIEPNSDTALAFFGALGQLQEADLQAEPQMPQMAADIQVQPQMSQPKQAKKVK